MTRQARWLVATLVFTGIAGPALAEDDAEHFAQGRVALDKFHDCPAALHAFSTVSSTGQQAPMWIYYEAQTLECLGRYGEALALYRQYKMLIPPSPELLNKIGEVAYLANQAADKKQAADQLAARQAATRADISGDWQTHNHVNAVVSLNESHAFVVKGTNSYDQTGYNGLYSQGNLTLTSDDTPKWSKDALRSCPDLSDAEPVTYDLTISPDGQTLSGTRESTQADLNSCDTNRVKTRVIWTRIQ